MGITELVEKKFKKFVAYCESQLGKEAEQIVILINKRYKECGTHFRESENMLELITSTKANMKSEPQRNIVHLKDFLNELKAYRKKRKAKDECGDRVAKLRKLDDNVSETSSDGMISDTDSVTKKSDKLKEAIKTKRLSTEKTEEKIPNGDHKICEVVLSDDEKCQDNSDKKDSNDIDQTDKDNLNSVDKIDKIISELNNKTHNKDSSSNSLKNCDEVLLTKLKVEASSKLSSEIKSCDSDSDVVMIESDDNETNKITSTDQNDSIVIIDSASSTQSTVEQKSSLLSFLNLKQAAKTNSNDDDVIICESEKTSSGVKNLEKTELPKLNGDVPCSSKTESNKLKTDKKSTGKTTDKKTVGEITDEAKKKSEKHIKRLEGLLESLKNKIEEMRHQEMTKDDLDDETSSYIFEDKLKRKFVTVWNKLCELKGRNRTTGRPAERVFNYGGSRYEEINKKLERLINKHKQFPDFHDVKNVIKKVNRKSNLGLSNSQIDGIARESFLDVGNMLQERRHKDFMCTFRCQTKDDFSMDRDPALFDSVLQRKLEENQKHGKNKLEEIINKFADKQLYDDDSSQEVVEDKKVEDGGEISDEDEEEEEEDDDVEVEEEIIDVDQFVDDTEALASYTPSRPAITKNPRLADFHSQVQPTTSDSDIQIITDGSDFEKNQNDNNSSVSIIPDEPSTSSSKTEKTKSDVKRITPTLISVEVFNQADSNMEINTGKLSPADTNLNCEELENLGIKTPEKEPNSDVKRITPTKISSPSVTEVCNEAESDMEIDTTTDANSRIEAENSDSKTEKFSSADTNPANVESKNLDKNSPEKKTVSDSNAVFVKFSALKSSESRSADSEDKLKAENKITELKANSPGLDLVISKSEAENKITNSKSNNESVKNPSKTTTKENTPELFRIDSESDEVCENNLDPNSEAATKCNNSKSLKSLEISKTDPKKPVTESESSLDSTSNLDKVLLTKTSSTVNKLASVDTSTITPTETTPSSAATTSVPSTSTQEIVNNSKLDSDLAQPETNSNDLELEFESDDKPSSSVEKTSEILKSDRQNSEFCDLSEDSQSNDGEFILENDIADEDDTSNSVYSQKTDGNSTNSCDADLQGQSTKKVLFLGNLSDNSQSNDDCQVVDKPDSECVVIDENEADCVTLVKRLKLPKFLNANNSPGKIRNKVTNLVNKAKQNIDGDSKFSTDLACSQVSTSSEDFSQEITKSVARNHLSTKPIKHESSVGSFVIEIDEADALDSSIPNDLDPDDDDVCQSTTCEVDNDIVSSSICEPDVIILSDSD